jgi:hypothetical protein
MTMTYLEVNQIKILETKSWLLEIIKDPTQFSGISVLNIALRSQTGLAKLTNSERNIVPCSLNTLKSNAESLLDRGFAELDELRINAREAIEAVVVTNKSGKTTRTELKNKVNELESKLNNIYKSNFLLSIMVTELREELKKMAFENVSSEQKELTYKELNKKIEAKLSFCFNGES